MKTLKKVLLALGFASGVAGLALHFWNPTHAPDWRLEKVQENRSATVLILNLNGKHSSTATGVVISQAGTVLTASHVADLGQTVFVVQKHGKNFDVRLATVAINDKESQLAILFTDRPFPHSVKIGRTRALREGDLVYTVGHPGGVSRPVVDAGVIAQRHHTSELPRQTTLLRLGGAPGMSGSPVFNARGELVGIYNALIGIPTISTVPHGQMELYGVMLSIDPLGEVIKTYLEASGVPHPPTANQ